MFLYHADVFSVEENALVFALDFLSFDYFAGMLDGGLGTFRSHHPGPYLEIKKTLANLLKKSSNPYRVPPISLSSFIMIHIRDPMHLSKSSARGLHKEGGFSYLAAGYCSSAALSNF